MICSHCTHLPTGREGTGAFYFQFLESVKYKEVCGGEQLMEVCFLVLFDFCPDKRITPI